MAGLFGPVPLDQYVDLIAAVPLPTHAQREHFAEYVSHAHSWYKHLSLYPPGSWFHFVINRHAGCDRKHGTPIIKDRTEQGFHYNQIPTDVYRTAFWYLDYSTGSRNTVPLVVPVGERSVCAEGDGMPEADSNYTLMYGLPEEIFDAGAVRLTGVIHTLSAAIPFLWGEDRRPDQVDWPVESGGLGALDRIVDRCRQMREPNFTSEETGITKWPLERYPHSDHHVGFVDPVLYELLAPERRRQQINIIQAIDRVCEMIEHQRSGRH